MESTESFMTSDDNRIRPHTTPQEENVDGVYASCTPAETMGESAAMAREENEGDRLDQVLAGHGLNRNKLAKIAGVGPSTIQGWHDALRRGDITKSTWHKLARALQAANVDPNEVRPTAEIPAQTRSAQVMPALLDIIERKDRNALTLALELLTIDDPGSRALLVSLVSSALNKL